MSAEVSKTNNSITLYWPLEEAVDYNIFRKEPGGTSWGGLMATVAGDETQYVDSSIEVGKLYEYLVLKATASGTGYGYIYSGIEVPPVHFRGRLLFLLDDRFSTPLESEINELITLISGDGWDVELLHISMDSSVTHVKAVISHWYNTFPELSKTVFLFGHIPVPYSGNINPDGHNDHVGAWSADVFYGEINGNWTDVSVNNTTGSQNRTHNVPGDGKYDNSVLPSDLELEIGRVDFYNLPLFEESEEELLRKYINKNIAFRTKAFVPQRRALIENNFAGFAEGFGQNGLRTFPTMFGDENTAYMDYDNLLNDSYMWSYGCGGGNYQGASGISNTNRLTSDSLQTVFTMLFGSYFGDWDSQNNFLRSALASGTVLTNAWAGRPVWVFHPMAMGLNIGYCAKLSQNNSFIYNTGFGARFVHTGLMGDPSLRMHIVAPPENLTVVEDNANAVLSWEAPDENVYGYYLYKSNDEGSSYVLMNDEVYMEESYTDSCLAAGADYHYMVKTSIVETSASGSYINLSPGARASVNIQTDKTVISEFEYELIGLEEFAFTNLSQNAMAYFWNFGDGFTSEEENPQHSFASAGDFNVSLIAFNECRADTVTQSIAVSSTNDEEFHQSINVFPNPVSDRISIEYDGTESVKFTLTNAVGSKIKDGYLRNGLSSLYVSELPSGYYILSIQKDGSYSNYKLLKQE